MNSTTNAQPSPVATPASTAAPRPSPELKDAMLTMGYDSQFQTLLNFCEQPVQFYWMTTYYAAANYPDPAKRDGKKAAVILALWSIL